MVRPGEITNAVNMGITVQADWENLEFISHISLNVRRLFEFLVQFGMRKENLLFCLFYFVFLLLVFLFVGVSVYDLCSYHRSDDEVYALHF